MALRGFPTRPNGTLFNLTEVLDQYTVENDLSSVIWSVLFTVQSFIVALTLYII